MRALLQRISEARVLTGEEILARVGSGLCVFLGVGREDTENDADALAHKVKNVRIFEDSQGKMNRSVVDTGGSLLVVSQFTLYADCRRGNRPSFTDAASAAEGERLYRHFIGRLRLAGLDVATGRFGARMSVNLVNDGPVTLFLET